MTNPQPGLVRPTVTERDAEQIARSCYGIDATAQELGSNQDRNFLLIESTGARSVLRIDHPVFEDASRDAQHLALDAYADAGIPVARVLAGPDGALTQRWQGLAVRRSEFAAGEPMLDCGYLAPTVIEEFGALAAASVNALATLSHPGLDRAHMWDMRVAHDQVVALASSITDAHLRRYVLDAASEANDLLEPLRQALPVQAIHGDLTDDNVMGVRGEDSRLHPATVLDFGDLSYGWRIAELAVTISSLLHHEPDRPLRVIRAVEAFHRQRSLEIAEARALWPLVVLRSALLVASAHRQLEIDRENAYAESRLAGERAMLEAATAHPPAEVIELVLAALGFQGVPHGAGLKPVAPPAPMDRSIQAPPLRSLIPDLDGGIVTLDPGVESAALHSGFWLEDDAEDRLAAAALADGAAAVVIPYGVFRLTRAEIDTADAARTWPSFTELVVAPGPALRVSIPELQPGPWRVAIDGASNGVLEESDAPRRLRIAILRADAPPGAEQFCFVQPDLVPAWGRFTHDPAAILGLESLTQHDASQDELLRRERIFASAQERYYERPMQIERGWRHHLIDTTARSYVDMVNNVTALGHGHPGVADAVNRQIRILNTNSRFLYRELAEYSERLLALLPDEAREPDAERGALDTVLLVNSGSEAVDLALRLAQAATGRKTVIALREAYHGWTMASDAVTTSAYDNPFALENRPEWIHIADVPNRFRGTYRGDAEEASIGRRYAEDLGADLERLAGSGREVAGFICESVLGNAGGVLLPAGYLVDAYRRVRDAGGLCIADEVQVGFGRLGTSFWGFEQAGVIPDIITIAKPMGNGFPIGGVITSKRVADALATQGQFFASTGGNPLSCRVGLAVLDAMEAEGLQQNARDVGARLKAGFERLADRHPIIGPVHGEGLYLGIELVRDRTTMEPAAAEAAAICERLRELGVIVLTTSERSNVLKIKPPLCLTSASADFVVRQLDRVLTEGW